MLTSDGVSLRMTELRSISTLDGDGDEGEVFAAAAVDDVADQDGFGLLFGSGVCICRKAAEQQAQQQNI